MLSKRDRIKWFIKKAVLIQKLVEFFHHRGEENGPATANGVA